MSIEGILIGLLAIGIGLAWAFYGLKAFLILLPIWAFFIGALLGASWVQELLGDGFFSTVTSWVVAIIFGLFLAVISYLWYTGAVLLLGFTIGYTLGAGLMSAIGLTEIMPLIIGVIIGAVVAIGFFVLGMPLVLVIVATAIGGAVAATNGALLLLGRIQLEDIDSGLSEGLLKDGAIGIVVAIAIAVAGALYQMRDVANAASAIDRSAYRIQ
jgi:Domain of unknown function (DUF4203)